MGVIFGPLSANLVNPAAWFDHDPHTLLNFTLHFSRVVIGIQVFFNGANLPKKYIKTEWFSLFMVLGPLMTAGMLVVGLLIWGLIPGLSYLEALVIAACVTPTDPVLANSICKGGYIGDLVSTSTRSWDRGLKKRRAIRRDLCTPQRPRSHHRRIRRQRWFGPAVPDAAALSGSAHRSGQRMVISRGSHRTLVSHDLRFHASETKADVLRCSGRTR